MPFSSRRICLLPSSAEMLLLRPSFTNPAKTPHLFARRRPPPCPPQRILAMAKQSTESDVQDTVAQRAAIAGGLISTPVIGWSLYTLKTTGCGLPPGPGGSVGALEGVSYLVVAGIVGWSLYTKAKTGSGLPGGPLGLLGAVEGLSYLTLLAVVVVFALQFAQNGSLPGPLPTEQCFG